MRLANGLGAVKGKWTSSHQHTNHLSGWLGDITIGNSPSMNNADYKADLDAVNIVSIMKKQGIDYQTASNQYYDAINSGSYNRATQFVQNLGGISKIKKIIYDEVGISASTDAAAMNTLKKKNPVAYNFIINLQNNNSEYE